jgi:hypothetical protein
VFVSKCTLTIKVQYIEYLIAIERKIIESKFELITFAMIRTTSTVLKVIRNSEFYHLINILTLHFKYVWARSLI